MYMTSYSTGTPTAGKYTLNRFGKDDFDLLEREGRDHVEIAQIVCREFTILNLQKNTVHRGIKNRSDYDRPMLMVYFSPMKDYKLLEEDIESDTEIPKRKP